MAFGRKNRTSAGTADGTAPAKHSFLGHLLRILQFLSAFTSLILFSVRIAKIIRLYGKATRSNGAVEGILAAAVAYTILATLLQLGIKATKSTLLRIFLIIMDILFMVAFIVVAVLTSPKRHGSSAPCQSRTGVAISQKFSGKVNCSLPYGTFALAIFSTILHALTVAFHAHKARKTTRRDERVANKEGLHDGNSMDSSPVAGRHHANGVDRV